jgi:hypothetical protein
MILCRSRGTAFLASLVALLATIAQLVLAQAPADIVDAKRSLVDAKQIDDQLLSRAIKQLDKEKYKAQLTQALIDAFTSTEKSRKEKIMQDAVGGFLDYLGLNPTWELERKIQQEADDRRLKEIMAEIESRTWEWPPRLPMAPEERAAKMVQFHNVAVEKIEHQQDALRKRVERVTELRRNTDQTQDRLRSEIESLSAQVKDAERNINEASARYDREFAESSKKRDELTRDANRNDAGFSGYYAQVQYHIGNFKGVAETKPQYRTAALKQLSYLLRTGDLLAEHWPWAGDPQLDEHSRQAFAEAKRRFDFAKQQVEAHESKARQTLQDKLQHQDKLAKLEAIRARKEAELLAATQRIDELKNEDHHLDGERQDLDRMKRSIQIVGDSLRQDSLQKRPPVLRQPVSDVDSRSAHEEPTSVPASGARGSLDGPQATDARSRQVQKPPEAEKAQRVRNPFDTESEKARRVRNPFDTEKDQHVPNPFSDK